MNSLTPCLNIAKHHPVYLQNFVARPCARRIVTNTQALHRQPYVLFSHGIHTGSVRSLGRPSTFRFLQRRHASLPRRSYSGNPKPDLSAQSTGLSVSQRFRKLSREYGWTAMGVYLALSALDFPFCFAAVRWLGPERVGKAEERIVEGIKGFIPEAVKDSWRQAKRRIQEFRRGSTDSASETKEANITPVADILDGYDHGVVDAELQSRGINASIWTQLALAYAIHKSFIFIRLPITVAILPKVVKTLRGWGWQIGKRKVKVSAH